MKFLGTHHDTGVKLPTVGNAIWLSMYLNQYYGSLSDFLDLKPCDAGKIQKDIYIDRRTYRQQLSDAQGVRLLILCIRCLPGEIDHFIGWYIDFGDEILTYLSKLGFKNVKIELLSEPIELISAKKYVEIIKEFRSKLFEELGYTTVQLLAGAGDLHHKQHQDYYKYLRDHGFHEFDCWSIHCINDPLQEMIWAVKNLGDKPIHITEFTTLDHLLAWGASDPITLWFLNECLTFAQKQSKIKSLLQVFPAYIEGKYKGWSIHKSAYLTKLKEFYNKHIKEETVKNIFYPIVYGEKSQAVREMQEILKILGYDPKYLDGDFGPLTKEALHSFQKSCGLGTGDSFGLDEVARVVEHMRFLNYRIWHILDANKS